MPERKGVDMSQTSALRQYLELIQTQWEQMRGVIEDVESPVDEDRGRQPPDAKCSTFRDLFVRAAVEVSQTGDSDAITRMLKHLHYVQVKLIEEVSDCRRRRAWWPLPWKDVRAAWNELDDVAVVVEAGLRVAKESEKVQAPAKPIDLGLGFDDEDIRILKTLGDRAPLRMTGSQIAGHCSVSAKTVLRRLKTLCNAGLVSRPRGPNGGATITDAGIEVLKSIPPEK